MNFFHHPYVNGDVAKYLVDNGVRFIGIDTINADQTGGTEFPVHDLFSEKRLMIGENWAFFDQIDFERPYVIALPMKLIGCDGSPVRAIAVQWRKNNGCEKNLELCQKAARNYPFYFHLCSWSSAFGLAGMGM